MCLLAVAQDVRADYPFILISNRDMWSARAKRSAPVQQTSWRCASDGEHSLVFSLDEQSGGSWLAVDADRRRVAVVLNVGGRGGNGKGRRFSRGQLVLDAAAHGLDACRAAADAAERAQYPGFNLVAGSISGSTPLGYLTNCDPALPPVRPLATGRVHAIGNDLYDDDPVRARHAQHAVAQLLSELPDGAVAPDELVDRCAAVFAQRAYPPTASCAATLNKFLLWTASRRRQPGLTVCLAAAPCLAAVGLAVLWLAGALVGQYVYGVLAASLLLAVAAGFVHHLRMQPLFLHVPVLPSLFARWRAASLWTTVAQTVVLLDRAGNVHYYYRDTNDLTQLPDRWTSVTVAAGRPGLVCCPSAS